MRQMSALSMHRHKGFSLVELMVGLAIGMIAAIIVLQVFAISEERKRNTTSGADAMSNGAIMFFQMQRDITLAGYGFAAAQTFNCNLTWTAGAAAIATPVPLAPVTINPAVTIIPAGDANTDTMLVMYGNTNGQPQGNAMSAAGTTYTVQLPAAFAVGDRVVAAPAACGAANLLLDRVATSSGTGGGSTITVDTGGAGTTLYNLGPAPRIQAYAIRNKNLTVCDYMVNDCGLDANKNDSTIWLPIASNIVSMRAMYARDINRANDHQVTPTTSCEWTRIPAINLVLIARSVQYDKNEVTSDTVQLPLIPVANAPTWTDSAGAPLTMPDTDWKHYRYKVFQGLVPIRNVGWMQTC